MKKVFYLLLVAVMFGGLAQSCTEDETTQETIDIYSPDKDEVKPPGSNGNG